jgi:hypothetical protein
MLESSEGFFFNLKLNSYVVLVQLPNEITISILLPYFYPCFYRSQYLYCFLNEYYKGRDKSVCSVNKIYLSRVNQSTS